jgi:phosphatidylserine decarboxylase
MFAREGFPYMITPAAMGATLVVLGRVFISWPAVIAGAAFLGLAVFMAYFFRDPARNTPCDPELVVSPADGKVTRVEKVEPGNGESSTVVSIFLSPFDVHINRSPVAGQITDVFYAKGKFLMATNEKASLVNEQNSLTIKGREITVVCKQIAGILARRIVCWKHAGDHLAVGERFGLIKFSSRTDLILPSRVQVEVSVGARVRGGETIIGRIV